MRRAHWSDHLLLPGWRFRRGIAYPKHDPFFDVRRREGDFFLRQTFLSVFAPSDAPQLPYIMTASTPVNARSFSTFWLPALLILGGLVLAGCGSTAPVVSSINTPDTLETGESGTYAATIDN